MRRRRSSGTCSGLLASCYPPQANLLSADEQGSSILFSNLFALLSPDIYTHFCLVGRYLHLAERSKIFSEAKCCCKAKPVWRAVLPNRWDEEEKGCKIYIKQGLQKKLIFGSCIFCICVFICISPSGPGSRNISPQRDGLAPDHGDPETLQEYIDHVFLSLSWAPRQLDVKLFLKMLTPLHLQCQHRRRHQVRCHRK